MRLHPDLIVHRLLRETFSTTPDPPAAPELERIAMLAAGVMGADSDALVIRTTTCGLVVELAEYIHGCAKPRLSASK